MTATRLLARDSGLKYAGKSAYGSYSSVTYVVLYSDGAAAPFDETKNGMFNPGKRLKMPPLGTLGDAIITQSNPGFVGSLVGFSGGAPGSDGSRLRRTFSATTVPSE